MKSEDAPQDREIKYAAQIAAIGVKGLMETFLNPDMRAWYGSILVNIALDKDAD